MIEILSLALAAGAGVAIATGPLGCFAVWRRMAYFGDTLAHSALTGIAFALLLDVNTQLGVTAMCVFTGILLIILQQKSPIATDTLLGILSHSMLALGLVVVSLFGDVRVDLYGYLFGDLLAVNESDVLAIFATTSLLIIGLIWLWKPLLSITINESMAQVDGVRVTLVKTLLMLMMALVVSQAMKVVGILLITALLILPAATSRRFARSPIHMAVLASLIGIASIAGGLAASWWIDTPAGPSAVLVAAVLFVASQSKRPAL